MSLSDKAGLAFRLSYIEKITGKAIEKKVKKQILEFTGGQGKLSRLAVEAYLTTTPHLNPLPQGERKGSLAPRSVGEGQGEGRENSFNFFFPSELYKVL